MIGYYNQAVRHGILIEDLKVLKTLSAERRKPSHPVHPPKYTLLQNPSYDQDKVDSQGHVESEAWHQCP